MRAPELSLRRFLLRICPAPAGEIRTARKGHSSVLPKGEDERQISGRTARKKTIDLHKNAQENL